MTKYVTTGRKNTDRIVYHTDKDCHKLTRSEVRETNQSEIEYHNLRECQACQGKKAPGGDGSDWKEFTHKLRSGEIE